MKLKLQTVGQCGDCAWSTYDSGECNCSAVEPIRTIKNYRVGMAIPDWCPMPDAPQNMQATGKEIDEHFAKRPVKVKKVKTRKKSMTPLFIDDRDCNTCVHDGVCIKFLKQIKFQLFAKKYLQSKGQ